MNPTNKEAEPVKKAVRDFYALAANRQASACGCGPATTSCCGSAPAPKATQSLKLGYSPAEIEVLPEGADLGLGCGNPNAIARLKLGETVLDLGSGAGIDCFLAARAVGANGKVIGVDMTPEMVNKARENAMKVKSLNTDFRLGEIEHLPVDGNSVDVVISNCVLNLVPDKLAAHKEIFRVLKPGGRVAISDIVATAEVPEEIRKDTLLWSQCAAGALHIDDLTSILTEAGFERIRITSKDSSRDLIKEWRPGSNLGDYFVSADIEAVKPA
jgi:arsenite methyltransferase